MSLALLGPKLGKYELLSEIGQGGMSVVYRAKDSQLERLVALKVMHAFLAEQPEARARFHREAVAVARLRHPNIIEIYDYSGEDAAQSYIVTELVNGFSLAEMLKRGALRPPEAALVIARPVVDALAHAHAQGVIHRDLKPENILVGKDGALKLTDFGIAQMLDNQTLTVTGTLLGSPAYMAPETIDGDKSDQRSDIYAFGAMLYQFVVGRLPFEAQSPHSLLRKIVAGECMPPEQANPAVHAGIARVIKRCLAKEPNQRFQTAKELLAAIDALLARLDLADDSERLRLLADPAAYEVALTERLCPKYVALGKACLAARRVGAALEDFDRVLSIDRNHVEVRKLVRRLTRRAWTSRVVRDAVISVLGAALVTFGLGSLLAEPRTQRGSESATTANQPGAEGRNVTFVLRGGAGTLYIDGQPIYQGPSDAVSHELSAGAHRARYVSGKVSADTEFLVPPQGSVPPVKLDVTPHPAAVVPGPKPPTPAIVAPENPPAPTKSKLVQFRTAGGRWVNVAVDDEMVAKEKQSPVSVPLTYGRHRVRFSNPCCEPKEITVEVSDTEPPVLEPIDLRPSPARLYIEGAPQGALVEVAGKRVGLNPGEPVYVPMESTEPAEHTVLVTRGAQVLLKEKAVFEPGRERRLAVKTGPL